MTRRTDIWLRPEQKDIIENYSGGKVGIAAVPGSGKTFTLAHLAARLIASGTVDFAHQQEVLVVTFTNSAVNSFQARIARILQQQYNLLPSVGYRVRTLHGLAHDIVRERPALVGLADDFTILDERLSLEIQRDIIVSRLAEWWDMLSGYTSEEVDLKNARRRFENDLPALVSSFIKRAKDSRIEPETLLGTLAQHDDDQRFDLARFASSVYRDYQQSLSYRGAVDFDDLVRLALEALSMDDLYLQRLQDRWPYVLEDEAQDSSWLQEQMLRALSGNRNWVRVGDPNQAINTTFTTAEPRFLLEFLDESQNPDVVERPLSVSGRSVLPIIDLANELVRWTVEEHPAPDVRDAFDLAEDSRRGTRRGIIQPTGENDPQPNPPDSDGYIHLGYQPGQNTTPENEIDNVVAGEEYALREWLSSIQELPENERPTIAVLVPENSRGFKLAEMLRKYGILYEELLRSTTATRHTVTQLRTVIEYLADPGDLRALKQVYWVLMPSDRRDLVRDDSDLRQVISKFFAQYQNIEELLWPVRSAAPLSVSESAASAYPWLADDLAEFSIKVQRWLRAISLPVDQLVLTIGQNLFTDPVDVALIYKVAVTLRSMAKTHPDWRLPEFAEELRIISSNERKFIGFDDAESGYEPKPGIVTVATMHAAKGLEWDRVYLMAVSNYGFPSALPYDSYIGERWYVRDSLNLEAEVLAQLAALSVGDPDRYDEGQATRQARLDYAEERLRLLYVGITRARRQLIITWNMGRFWKNRPPNQPAQPLVALWEYTNQAGT